ncbi:hypothetical protein [Mycobacterium sp.]|uniref:hypothetical protein n=1 Tax=Mycobacterium sp. TaxID=1785 RepID=UPI002C236898|nr:hypothetical protein [Mycobacterium sp.]HKP42068.1 hypothetical protein [Mycobacterium sp.]
MVAAALGAAVAAAGLLEVALVAASVVFCVPESEEPLQAEATKPIAIATAAKAEVFRVLRIMIIAFRQPAPYQRVRIRFGKTIENVSQPDPGVEGVRSIRYPPMASMGGHSLEPRISKCSSPIRELNCARG